jgi:uncharacterized membrane protein YraQ (UPF0718 family)
MGGRPRGRGERSATNSVKRALVGFSGTLPLLAGVIILVGLMRTFVTREMFSTVFTGNLLTDTLLGSVIGSVSAGNPITSYVIGGELLAEGVSMYAVAAFIVAWVTVGVVQLPAEAGILGRRFALVRNLVSFVLSLVVAIATVIMAGAI